VLSPRALQPGQDYVVALVPSWQAETAADGSTTLADSWSDATASVTLPCFDSWTFRTIADPGDFATISRALEPLTDAEEAQLEAKGFGRAAVTVGPLPAVVPRDRRRAHRHTGAW
jgi:hypothetical protein